MTVLATLPGEITVATSAYPELQVKAYVVDDPPVFGIDVTVNTTISSYYNPGGAITTVPVGATGAISVPLQRIAMAFDFAPGSTSSSFRVDMSLLGSWSVNEIFDGGQEWSYMVPGTMTPFDKYAHGVSISRNSNYTHGVVGHELDWKAPPRGLGDVSPVGIYVVDGVEYEFVLISNGLATDSSRQISAEQHVMQVSGLGPEARYDKVNACLVLEEGHGLTHGEIIEALALNIGIPASKIAVGNVGYPLLKAHEILNTPGWSVIKEVADAISYVPYFDRDGVLRLKRYPSLNRGIPTSFVYDSANIAAATGASMVASGDVPTCILAKATRTVEGEDGIVTKTTITETLTEYAPPVAYATQSAVDGSISTTGRTSVSTFQVVSRQTVTTETCGDCLRSELVVDEAWHNPESIRYKKDTSEAIIAYYQTYLFEAGVKDDETTAYQWPEYRFVEVSRQLTLNLAFWDENPCNGAPAQANSWESPLQQQYTLRRKGLTAIYTGRWFRPQKALKDWNDMPVGGDNWDDVPVIASSYLVTYANGDVYDWDTAYSNNRYGEMYLWNYEPSNDLYLLSPLDQWSGSFINPKPSKVVGGSLV